MFGKEICFLLLLLLSLLAVSTAEDRIYDGKAVPPNDLPYVVKLWIYNRDYAKNGMCTGTIISKHHVLTAAHCWPKGSYAVKINTRDNNQPVLNDGHWTIHPGYPGKYFDHDIAIITVVEPLTIPPALLGANYTHKKDDWLRVAGYGNTKYEFVDGELKQSEVSRTLMETYVQGVALTDPEMVGTELRAFYPNVNGILLHHKTGVLQGDNGGPVFAQGKDGKWYQVGVSSHGGPTKDNDIIAFATDVSYYCPWIEETTGGEVKCQTFEPAKIVPPF
uniref:Peptidase S1 domain-containing protein n=1 Tax=Panagrolaimus sp. JU765 TaxID=591449 RepID=A0AC34PWP3_9BILA